MKKILILLLRGKMTPNKEHQKVKTMVRSNYQTGLKNTTFVYCIVS